MVLATKKLMLRLKMQVNIKHIRQIEFASNRSEAKPSSGSSSRGVSEASKCKAFMVWQRRLKELDCKCNFVTG